MNSLEEIFQQFEQKQKIAIEGVSKEKIEKQLSAGKKTARTRIVELLDPNTFNEIDQLVVHRSSEFGMDKQRIAGDGVITGYGKIDGKIVYVYAYDFTVFGGTLSRANADKIIKLQNMALKTGAPIIGLNDSGGARIQEGVESLAGYAEIFYNNVRSSGVVPQITCVMGPCAGGAVYSPALNDFIIMVKDTSYMFVTGPDVIKAVTHEDVSKEDLGGAITHNSRSGVAHFLADNDEQALMLVRELMSFLPPNNMEGTTKGQTNDDPNREDEKIQTIVPADPNKPYDIKDLIINIIDDANFLEVQSHFAKNIVIGFARMAGQTVGIVANQPAHLAGALDINSSVKSARFIRFCDAFNIPLITFVDVPGFLPGIAQETGGIIKHGSKLLYAYAEATVPKLTVITRKAYGGAYCVMSSKQVGADINYAYPTAEIAVMGPEGAVSIIHRNSINNEDEKQRLINEYRGTFATPYKAAELGYIDEIIMPKQTRSKLIHALELTKSKIHQQPPRKHGNIAL
ncbi:MAG: acyl-CoA carboxylase subunit beta [Bacteroidales bacterium]|jgi:propionyl-CoA carboxylase beta chain|nr:acyl-CoA carboxylase subunit beta [Bacteroidales bacterium]MDD4385383.1 acyl-CoA carboxylase subunit beta [Bacteroidales bacterium]MDY0198109.1 acyl-CoA carboxylase subunit beta [Tenuifilaceae bacterium]